MHIYILRTTGLAPSYERVEANSIGDIQRLTRSAATPQRAFDWTQDEGSFIHAVMCQGVSLQSFDHYSIRPGSIVRLYGWNDDPEDWPAPWGIVWEFRKPRPDPAVGNRVNTLQFCTVYGNDEYYANDTTTGGPVVHLPWADWQEPPPGLTFHGVWTSDEDNDRHLEALSRGNLAHGWREWAD